MKTRQFSISLTDPKATRNMAMKYRQDEMDFEITCSVNWDFESNKIVGTRIMRSLIKVTIIIG